MAKREDRRALQEALSDIERARLMLRSIDVGTMFFASRAGIECALQHAEARAKKLRKRLSGVGEK